MLAWILEQAGLNPGYLIGGAPNNFEQSARLGDGPFFVVEADEYDTSYFDRRSKFVHYRPRTLIVNNLEYDHADIFPDIDAIQAQFHLLLRTVPQGGLVVVPSDDEAVNEVLHQGCWTPIARVGSKAPRKPVDHDNGDLWSATQGAAGPGKFEVLLNDVSQGLIEWSLKGAHNRSNALNAIAAARHAGVPTDVSINALNNSVVLNVAWKLFLRTLIQSFMTTLPIIQLLSEPLCRAFAIMPAQTKSLPLSSPEPTPCLLALYKPT